MLLRVLQLIVVLLQRKLRLSFLIDLTLTTIAMSSAGFISSVFATVLPTRNLVLKTGIGMIFLVYYVKLANNF
jgi:hypothetical protein